MSYNATLADGSPLPAWLSFDPIACAFSGTPDITDVGALQILVIAVDADNQQVSAPFTLYVEPPQLPAGQGLGLLGYYYNGIFGSFSTDEIDPQVAFNWSDFPLADTSYNGEMWTGQVLAPNPAPIPSPRWPAATRDCR